MLGCVSVFPAGRFLSLPIQFMNGMGNLRRIHISPTSPTNMFILKMKIIAQAPTTSHPSVPFSMNNLSKMSACRSKISNFTENYRETHTLHCTPPLRQ